MLKKIMMLFAAAAVALPLCAIEEKHGVLVGEVLRLDSAAKRIVVKAADGTEHAFRFTARTAVHGLRDTGEAARDVFHGLKAGTSVAVHYTEKGGEKSAEAVDHIGKDGLKASTYTVREIDRGGKKMIVETEKGGRETLHLTDLAARDAGKDIEKGSEKTAKVTVYYTEEGGKKIVHFFKKAI